MTDVTHLGIFDIPMISNIPNLVYIAPTTKEDYLAVLDWSIEQTDYPVAIRVPVAELVSTGKPCTKNFAELNKYEVAQQGGKIAVIALGSFYGMGNRLQSLLRKKQAQHLLLSILTTLQALTQNFLKASRKTMMSL